MKSIRRTLLANLLATFVGAWLLVCGATWLVAQHEIEEIFDAELAQSSDIIAVLALEQFDLPRGGARVAERSVFGHAYERSLSFQIWEGERLVLRSQSAPDERLCVRPGFADREVDGHAWRVSQRTLQDDRYTVCTAESYAVRREIVANITWSTLAPALLLLPLVAVAVWAGIGRGLAPLDRVTAEIGRREPDGFESIGFAEAPEEVRPLTDAINLFLGRLRDAFERESRFTADAAHELRTPLAAIKTQAQVALRATDTSARARSLGHLVSAVDNSARLIDQMLTLARYERLAAEQVSESFDAVGAIAQAAEGLAPLLASHAIRLHLDPPAGQGAEVRLQGLPVAFGLLVRNLVENAVNHAPGGGEVRVSIRGEGAAVVLDVCDQGPGIPAEHRERVFDRFFRGNASVPGSGLGLAIVRRIADLHGAAVELGEGEAGRGLRVRVRFPRAS